jgi:hypothetical protein
VSFTATTTVTVTRGETTDDFGDPIEAATVVASGIPASILEVQSRAQRPVEGRTDNVRAYTMRVRTNVTVQRDDRIHDERTGTMYTIDEVVTPVNPAGHAVRRIVLRRVT